MHQPHGSIYLKDKEAALPEVKRWLLDTYEVKQGAMVPKKMVYDAYRAFCARSDFEPADVSSFGKLFKRAFPEVDRKRLVKGWHYCNLVPRNPPDTSVPPAGCQPPDRLYHSDPVVPTSAFRPAHQGRPLSPPPRPESRGASPVPAGFSSRSRSPSPSSAIVRRAHSQSPVPTSPRHHQHHQPPLSPASFRPVSPHLVHPMPLRHPQHHLQPQPYQPSPLHPHQLQQHQQHPQQQHQQSSNPLDFFLASTGYHHIRRNPPPPVGTVEQEMTDAPPPVAGEERASSPVSVTTDIWSSAGTHLQLLGEVEYYVGVYRREVWGLNPVNPVALDMDTLRYLLTTEEGSRERSPLSLCCHLALSVGSTFAGDFRRGREYMNILRQQVSEMFDTSNYDVACVLRHLALASRMYSDTDREGLAKGAYYLTLSRQICERIGAINDENYLITLKMLSLYERVDVEEKLAFAATQPRWRKDWVGDYPFIEHYKYGKITEMARDDLFDIPKNILLLLDPPATYTSAKPLHEGLTVELGRLDVLEAKLGDLTDTYGSIHTLKMLRGLVFLMRTMCSTALQRKDDAFESALDFVQLVSELMRPYQAFCFVELSAKTIYMDCIIQPLLAAGRYDKLQELAGMAQPLAREFGIIDTFCCFLLDSLAAHQRRLSGQSPSAAMMASSPPPATSWPPSITVPPPPLPSFSMYASLHAALPVLPPLLPPQPGLDNGSYSYGPALSTSSSSSSSVSSASSVISPDRTEDSDDVESLHAYISSFLDQHTG